MAAHEVNGIAVVLFTSSGAGTCHAVLGAAHAGSSTKRASLQSLHLLQAHADLPGGRQHWKVL